MRLVGFGRGRIHFGCVRHFVAGEKGKHGSREYQTRQTRSCLAPTRPPWSRGSRLKNHSRPAHWAETGHRDRSPLPSTGIAIRVSCLAGENGTRFTLHYLYICRLPQRAGSPEPHGKSVICLVGRHSRPANSVKVCSHGRCITGFSHQGLACFASKHPSQKAKRVP